MRSTRIQPGQRRTRMASSSRRTTGSSPRSRRRSCCAAAATSRRRRVRAVRPRRRGRGSIATSPTALAEIERPSSHRSRRHRPGLHDGVPTVRRWSTIRVSERTYSVPSRLIGHEVEARLHANASRSTTAGSWSRRCRGCAATSRTDRLPARHLVAGAQAGRLCALPLPRGALPVARVPSGLRCAAALVRRARRRRVRADPAPGGEHARERGRRGAGGDPRGRGALRLRRGQADRAAREAGGAGADGAEPDLRVYDALLAGGQS